MSIPEPRAKLPALPPTRFIGLVLVMIYATYLGVALQPHTLLDDAAIAFRYVERLASGEGFNYNDHERVLGASNPLYVLVLYLLTRAGLDVETAARGLALTFFPASVLLATCVTMRLAGPIAGTLAGVILGTDPFFRYQALSGMESILAVCLGLLVVLLILEGHEVAAGVFLGLAIWNKLDAGLLAAAIAVAWVAVQRALPVKLALVSTAVLLPWLLFATWYYGSPIPNSLIAKLTDRASGHEYNPFWIMGLLARRWVFILGTLAFVGLLGRLSTHEKLAALSLLGWFAGHLLAFSLVDLGDFFPWYLTVLVPPLVILACAFASKVPAYASRISSRFALGAILTLLLILGVGQHVRQTYDSLAAGNPITTGDTFDADRRLAGVFIRQYARPDEVVESGYGWVAFEAKGPFNDLTGLNSKVMRFPASYFVNHGYPHDRGAHPPRGPDGFIPLAVFNLASDMFPGHSWFTVFGRPDSEIARSGARYLQYRLFELPPPQPYSADHGLERVRLVGLDLQAFPPSGAVFSISSEGHPVHVVFTPVLGRGRSSERANAITFALLSEGRRVWQRDVSPIDDSAPIILRLDDATNLKTRSIAFLTSSGLSGESGSVEAVWRDVKVVVGDAHVDARSLRSQPLVDAWARFNPVLSGPSRR